MGWRKVVIGESVDHIEMDVGLHMIIASTASGAQGKEQLAWTTNLKMVGRLLGANDVNLLNLILQAW